MAFFEFPHTRTYDSDLGWLIKNVGLLKDQLEDFYKVNVLKYAEPLEWSIANNYGVNTLAVHDDTMYISMKPVPAGIDITDGEYWQPVGAFGGVTDGVKRYATEQDLITAQGLISGDLVETAGFYTVDDGGAALYYITSTAPASGWYETINNNLYALLVSSGAVNIKQMGAHGDGETDDTAIIQAAVDTYKEIYFPDGVYAVSDSINITKYGITMFGNKDVTRILQTVSNKNGLNVTNQHFTMFNMGVFSSDASSNTAVGIYKNSTFYMTLDNVTIDGFATGLFIDGTGNQGSDWLQNLHIYNYESYGFRINKCVDIYLVNFMFHAFTHPAEAGVYLTNKCESINIVNGDILRGKRGLLTDSDSNFVEDGRVFPAFSRFTNVFFDSYMNSCEINKTHMITFVGCWFSYNTESGNLLNITRSHDTKFIGCNFNSALNQAVNVADTCKSISFDSCTFRQINRSNGSGVAALYLNATYCSVTNCLFTDPPGAINTDYSIQMASGAINSIISGNRFERYRTTPILNAIDTAANYQIINNVGAGNAGGTLQDVYRINNAANAFNVPVPNHRTGSPYMVILINGNQTRLTTIEIPAAGGTCTIRDMVGAAIVTAEFDAVTKILTITPTSTLWGPTLIFK